MDKIIVIDGKEVGFKATAKTPRLYRFWIGRDMIQDMNNLAKSFNKVRKKKEDEDVQLSIADLTIFENCAWVMAKQYDMSIADNPDDWLDEFEMFSVYQILPELLELWSINNLTTSTPKKK